MVIHYYDFQLSGDPQIDPMISQLAIRRAFSKKYHTAGMTLQIQVYAV